MVAAAAAAALGSSRCRQPRDGRGTRLVPGGGARRQKSGAAEKGGCAPPREGRRGAASAASSWSALPPTPPLHLPSLSSRRVADAPPSPGCSYSRKCDEAYILYSAGLGAGRRGGARLIKALLVPNQCAAGSVGGGLCAAVSRSGCAALEPDPNGVGLGGFDGGYSLTSLSWTVGIGTEITRTLCGGGGAPGPQAEVGAGSRGAAMGDGKEGEICVLTDEKEGEFHVSSVGHTAGGL